MPPPFPAWSARTVWTTLGGLAATAILAWGLFETVGALAYETASRVDRVAAAGVRTVELRNSSGDVHVAAGEGDRVTVTADLARGLRDPRHEVRREGHRLVVDAGCPSFAGRCRISYAVEVPPGVAVVVRAGHGDVTARGLAGRVEVSARHGSVRAERLSGGARLTAGHGDIEASALAGPVRLEGVHGDVTATGLRAALVEARSEHGDVALDLAAPPRAVDARSGHGYVQVLLPRTGDAYAVEVASDEGTPRSAVRADPDAARTVTARSDEGDVDVAYR